MRSGCSVFPSGAAEMKSDDLNLADAAQFVWREYPITDGYITNDEGLVACRIHKKIRARRVWDVIMSCTYDYAEPVLC